jgi:Family of unknown function (DUF6498)
MKFTRVMAKTPSPKTSRSPAHALHSSGEESIEYSLLECNPQCASGSLTGGGAFVLGKVDPSCVRSRDELRTLAGVLWFGWSASTLLLVFWAETLLTGTANVARIALHRRLTRARGHWRRQLDDSSKRPLGKDESKGETTFLAEYSLVLYVFTLAHGFFLFLFLTMLDRNWAGAGVSPWQIDSESFRNGVLAVAAFALFELLYDAMTLRHQPFSWLKTRVQVALGRVVILHLVVIFGTFLMMRYETPMSMLGILVALKALMDVGASSAPAETPESPPRWLVALAKKQGLDMEREWPKILAEQKERAAEDEQVLPA